MQSFIDIFFFYEKIPFLIQYAGESFGFDTACLCSYPNFFNLILHLIIATFIITALARAVASEHQRFLSILLIGILFSALSKLIDWSQNILTATGETVFWSNTFDVFVESLQLIGISLILWGLFITLRKQYDNRTTSNSTPA